MCEENDMTPDRDESEDCHGSNDAMDLNISDKNVIAFPHEHHWALTQEFLAVFGGPGNVTLIDMTPASGAKLLGVLLSNGRGIGVARSQAHCKWIMENLIGWTRQKRLVPITQLPKPDSLVQYEKQNKPVPAPIPKNNPQPKAVMNSPQTPNPSPTPTTPVPKSAGNSGGGPSTPPVKPTGLLEAFGKVAQ
eukprot:s220_g27.t1